MKLSGLHASCVVIEIVDFQSGHVDSCSSVSFCFDFHITLMPRKTLPKKAKLPDVVSNIQMTSLYIERTKPALGTLSPPIHSDFTVFSMKSRPCPHLLLLPRTDLKQTGETG